MVIKVIGSNIFLGGCVYFEKVYKCIIDGDDVMLLLTRQWNGTEYFSKG